MAAGGAEPESQGIDADDLISAVAAAEQAHFGHEADEASDEDADLADDNTAAENTANTANNAAVPASVGDAQGGHSTVQPETAHSQPNGSAAVEETLKTGASGSASTSRSTANRAAPTVKLSAGQQLLTGRLWVFKKEWASLFLSRFLSRGAMLHRLALSFLKSFA